METTPREILEAEVEIVARTGKKIKFLGEEVTINGIPWHVLEDIGEAVIKIFQPMIELAVRSVGAGSSAAGADRLAVNLNALDPTMFVNIGAGAKETIEKLVTHGSDISWDVVREADFAVVIQLAIAIMKYNMGPSLAKNLSSDVDEILTGLGVPSLSVVPVTTLKPSSSGPDTEPVK